MNVFSDFPDPRCQGKVKHRFIDILVITVCAVIAGANAWTDIEHYGQRKTVFTVPLLPKPHVSNLRLEMRVGAQPQIITSRGISLWR
ncbi:transposase family protein [Xenorhabdus bovienii]|uniref:transposase family protein n=1 Tax=Xenorhabdus bovienii TaxID=40576 RepID=UPI001E3B7D36|nr:transposase family protein [Xenorhabdus bovienii]